MQDYIKRQQELRAQAWEQAKGLLDSAAAEGRDLDAAEQEQYDKINAELDERGAVIERLKADAEREARAAELRAPEAVATRTVAERPSDADMLRKLVSGEVRSYTFGSERRDLTTAADGEVVPQGFYDVLQRKLEYVGPMLEPGIATILRTEMGNDIKVPVESTRSAATATAEAAVFGESDPTFSTITLRAHKFGTLVQISRELLEDSGIDIVGFLADQFGVALGTAVNYALTLGTGTVQPNGIVTASGSGTSGGTGVSGAFTANNLIDLAHSVDAAYARRPGSGFMMNRASLGAVRKLQDGAGNYIYNPQVGGPDQLLGYRVIENPDIASAGTSVKSVLFGDFSAYHVRMVGAGVEVARSDDYAFANDLVTFRASMRVDGDLGGGGSDAVKAFTGGTA